MQTGVKIPVGVSTDIMQIKQQRQQLISIITRAIYEEQCKLKILSLVDLYFFTPSGIPKIDGK